MEAIFKTARGFSLIEILLVTATAIILLASVDTWLEDYRVRGHVAEAFMVAESAQARIVMTCASNDSLDSLSNEVLDHAFPYSPFVRTVTVDGSCDEPRIVVQTTNTGLFVEPMLVLVGDFSGTEANWSCNGTGMQTDMPDGCRGI